MDPEAVDLVERSAASFESSSRGASNRLRWDVLALAGAAQTSAAAIAASTAVRIENGIG